LLLLWNNRVFVRMFAAYSLSTLGDWFDFIAVTMLLGYVWQADPMLMALLPLVYAGPGLVLGQVAGFLADRRNKLRLMIATDLCRALLTAAAVFAPDPAWLFGVMLLRSCAMAVNAPAQQALTRHVVPPEQLLRAASLNGTAYQLGKLLGPLLGGTMAAFVSPSACLIVNACSFLLSAAILSSAGNVEEARPTAAAQEERSGFGESWKEGWQILIRSRVLFASTLYSLIALMAVQLVDAQFVVILREKAPAHPELLGWKTSAIGLGALLTVTGLGRFREITAYGWVLGGGVLLIGGAFAWLGLYRPGSGIHWLLIAAFLAGVGTGLTSVGSAYLRQKETPKEAIGRVMGIFDSLTSAIFIAAPLLGGLLITAWGASLSFQRIGFLIAAIGAAGILLQRVIWGRRRTEAASVQVSAE
jgi:MFS family permease